MELEMEMPEPISFAEAKKRTTATQLRLFRTALAACSVRKEDNGLHLRSCPVEGHKAVAIDWMPSAAVVGAKGGEKVPETMVLTAKKPK